MFKFIFVLILVWALFQHRNQITIQILSMVNDVKTTIAWILKPEPCEEPISYTIGTFDERFKISKDYFLQTLFDAETNWEGPSKMDLFVYVPEEKMNTLKINLVYDHRQEATQRLSSLGIVVDQTKDSYESLKSKFLARRSSYENALVSFNTRVAAFNTRKQIFQQEVNSWNTKGGAPKNVFDRLEAERLALETESRELQRIQNRLNKEIAELNALVVVLNSLATALNLSVDKYNEISTQRGESFEEGLYSSDGIVSEIYIYEFGSKEKLIRVLTHELGHALGLGHVDDLKAIMYKLNQGDNTKVNEADLAELKTVCEAG